MNEKYDPPVEIVLYKNGRPFDWYDPVCETKEDNASLMITLTSGSVHSIPRGAYDSYDINEME